MSYDDFFQSGFEEIQNQAKKNGQLSHEDVCLILASYDVFDSQIIPTLADIMLGFLIEIGNLQKIEEQRDR